MPASVLLQTILVAAAELGTAALSAIQFQNAVVVDRARIIHVIGDHESVRLTSSLQPHAPADRWVTHVIAKLSPSAAEPDTALGSDDLYKVDDQNVHHESPSVAELLRMRGVDSTPFAWAIDSSTCTPTSIVAEVGLRETSTLALLDAAVHIALLLGRADPRLFVPATVDLVRLERAPADGHGSVSIRRTGGNNDEVVVDVTVKASDGGTCLSIRSLRYVALDSGPAQSPRQDFDPRTFAHAITWRPMHDRGDEKAAPTGPRTVAVTGGDESANEDFRKRLEDVGYTPVGVDGARCVVFIAERSSVDAAEADVECAVRMSAEVAALVRQLAKRGRRDPVALWIITQGVYEAADIAALRQSCLWGLAGVIGAEYPELWGGLVDISVHSDFSDCVSALSRVLPTPRKSILVLRHGEFLARVWAPVAGEPVRGPLRCRPDAAYLVTGGMGALGLLMAAWLADRGARRLVLAGRTPLPPRRDWERDILTTEMRQKIAAIRALEMRGVAVDVVAVDVGSREGVQALLARRDQNGAPPIRGVIHAAGVVHDQLLAEMAEDPLRQVMWPKIGGGQALHEAFPPGSLDFFYLTASAATVFGIPGQGSYAAANAYLDALARARHLQGCNSLSLDWVAWRGLGFATDARIVAQELERLGSRELSPEEAFVAWEHVVRHDVAQAVVIPGRRVAEDDGSTVSDTRRSCAPPREWSRIAVQDLHNKLEIELRAILAKELLMPENELELDRPFVELGINSTRAMAVRREAEKLVSIELSAMMLWNYPTISSLAEYLANELLPQQEAEPQAAQGDSALSDEEMDLLSGVVEASELEAMKGAGGS